MNLYHKIDVKTSTGACVLKKFRSSLKRILTSSSAYLFSQSVERVAKKIPRGKWGRGEARKNSRSAKINRDCS